MSAQAKQGMTLVNSLAKVYDHKPMHKQGPAISNSTPRKLQVEAKKPSTDSFNLLDIKIDSLNNKMDRLIHIQEKVLHKLDGMSQDIDGIEKEVETLKVDKEVIEVVKPQEVEVSIEMKEICNEMTCILSAVNQRAEQHSKRLDGMEKIVISIQQAISFIGETVKHSRLMELICKGQSSMKGGSPSPVEKQKDNKCKHTVKRHASSDKSVVVSNKRVDKLRDHKRKDVKERSCLSLKGLRSQKKKKPPDTTETAAQTKQSFLDEEVQKLNKQNAEKSGRKRSSEVQDLEAGADSTQRTEATTECKFMALPVSAAASHLVDFILDVPHPEDSDHQAAATVQKLRERPEAETKSEKLKVAPTAEGEEELQEVSSEAVSDEDDVEAEEEKEYDEEENEAETEEASEEEEAATETSSEIIAEKGELPPERQPLDESSNDLSQKGTLMLERYEDNEKIASVFSEVETNYASEEGQSAEANSSKRRVTDEDLVNDDHKKSRVEEDSENVGPEEEEEEEEEDTARAQLESVAVDTEKGEEENNNLSTEEPKMEYIIDNSPPPRAPFDHRVVSAKPVQITNFYTINKQEILGGGRFGQVHKCIENSSGLTLAAKIIKARNGKEKEEIKNEIQVMNALNHANLIQLYAAYESKHDIILVMEYVDGGELFDRIIDENYNLTELDTILFIKQICEGVQYMHQMYILHLDLKPENILCVSRATNKIKIIDFGLARRYKPREKLKVNFGTPEFLAPEVINYDFVSFPTDMWSLGVITYMLLSGLSPFLGDDDNETLNNILSCQWSFEDEEFKDISEEAKDFISKLLVKEKCWRISAAESLKHPWLSDRNLHYGLHVKRNKCHSSHAPPAGT
ncbi:myosin light chain kinase 2, skeletal/cardiac muscle isoform X2 [Amia ocellicauda]|uniref:myosin light chain kinase 2, skeletal/cardiac muscle isoform X2 n=1 Tax=Amia ocellicauda TaxID=2972642 RepID=UPI003464084F